MIVIGTILGLLGLWLFLCDKRSEFAMPLIVIGMAAMAVGAAVAHDHNRPSLDSWYPSLRSPAGAPCCDGPAVDAVHLADVDWESRDGRYRVRIDGEWVDVPPGAVLDGPNRDGRTLVWPSWLDGKRTVRCFLPGAMT